MKIFFDEILSNTPIDYSAPEMKDIIDAVGEMIETYSKRISKRNPKLKIIQVVPSGSMADKTALWKTEAVETFNDDDTISDVEIILGGDRETLNSDEATDTFTTQRRQKIISDNSMDKIKDYNKSDKIISDGCSDKITSGEISNKILSNFDTNTEEITSKEVICKHKSADQTTNMVTSHASMVNCASGESVDKTTPDDDKKRDEITPGEDIDKLKPDEGRDRITSYDGMNRITSTEDTNSITSIEGTERMKSNEIKSNKGTDRIISNDGTNGITSNVGTDIITSEEGTDSIPSHEGRDRITSNDTSFESKDKIIRDDSTNKITSHANVNVFKLDEDTCDPSPDAEITLFKGTDKVSLDWDAEQTITSSKDIDQIPSYKGTNDRGIYNISLDVKKCKLTSHGCTDKINDITTKVTPDENTVENTSNPLKCADKTASGEGTDEIIFHDAMEPVKFDKHSENIKTYNATGQENINDSTDESTMHEYGYVLSDEAMPGITVTYEPYIEFDFLAVLEKPDNFKLGSMSCQGCSYICHNESIRMSEGCAVYFNGMNGFGRTRKMFIPSHPDELAELMHYELWLSSVLSCACSCIVHVSPYYCKIYSSGNCENCTIHKTTGYLQVAEGHQSTSYSIRLVWKSKSGSLYAPDIDSLQPSRKLQEIPIHVDFIPAYELTTSAKGHTEHECFLVAKRCTVCEVEYSWRRSYCRAEINHLITSVSDGHQKCFRVIKYLFEQLNIETEWPGAGTPMPLKSYEAKSAVLKHNDTCTATPDKYKDCVIKILLELFTGYQTGRLETFVNKINIAPSYTYQKTEMVKRLLHALQKIEEHSYWYNIFMPRDELMKKFTGIIMNIAKEDYLSPLELMVLKQRYQMDNFFRRYFNIKVQIDG